MTPVDRRAFLASTLAAAQPPPRRVRIAFLGAVHSHAADKIRIARSSPAWELAGVCEETDPALSARLAQDGIPILTRRQILADPSIEVVAVESAVAAHAADALACLEAGKHLHLEKPPSAKMDEFRRIVDAARRGSLLVQQGYMWRYHPGFHAALEAARNGWLGDVFLVRGTMNTLIGPDRRPEWALFRGGQMFEQGAHLIDPIVRLLGKPARITPFLARHGAFDDNLADNTAAVFEYPRSLAVVTSSVLHPNATRHRSFEIFGSNGSAVLRPIEPPVLRIDLAKAAGPYAAGMNEVKMPPFRRYEADFDDLARCVREKRPLGITLDDDLAVHETLLRASLML